MGATDIPRERTMFVIPPAAERSSLATTIATYACLAGTSIELIDARATSIAAAEVREGMSGTKRRRTFEGRCVAIIVSIAPNLFTSLEATMPEAP
jgi:hypothetical protein